MKEFIINTVKEAGKIAMDYLGNAKISMKKPKDFVTEADIAVEKFIVSKIKETYPNHNIIGEEEDYEKTNSDFTWYIDPIDGTANYAHADIHFAISVGIKKGNEIEYGIVYLPMINELYFAQKNQGAFLNGEKIQVSKIDNLKLHFSNTQSVIFFPQKSCSEKSIHTIWKLLISSKLIIVL